MNSVIGVNMLQEMEQSFLDYAMSVNTDRALPDVKDGLKPVHRRIIWVLHTLGLLPNKAHKKSARVVGEALGKYHPHGDSSVYEAMVRMAQEWAMRYPIVDGHGNFGSVDGDGAAAMRYTEARMAKITTEMLRDIKKDVVDFKPNFSEDDIEPVVLPTRIPNLLVNGTMGIGVAMACSFAPHNLTEVMNAIKAVLSNPDITIEEIHQNYITAPDFPTGGQIINQRELLEAYKTGGGRARIRGKYKVETNGRRENLVFYEIPYGVSKEKLIEDIAKMAGEKKIEGLSDVRDETNKHGMRIVFELKRDVNADVMANLLFRHTRLEDTYSINQVCLVNKEPKKLNLKQILEHYVAHQEEIITRRSKFELKKIVERLHLLEGILKALEDIDNVIALIKGSRNTSEAVANLSKKYKLSEVQSKAIVDMKLGKLTGLEKVKLENEKEELSKESERLEKILSFKEELHKVITQEIDEIIATYGDKRLTEVSNVIVKPDEKEVQYVQPEDVVVVMTKAGNVKRVSLKSFKVQNRNGKGIKNQDDIVMDVIKTNTIDNLLVFTALGKMFKIVVDQIPTGTNASRGTSIHTLVKMEEHDRAIAITSVKRETNAKYVVSISEKGMVKKTKIEEYTSAKRSGIAAVGLKDGDSIADIVFLDEEELLLITKDGMSIRFKTNNINSIGRTASGVRGIKLAEGDIIVAALPISKETDDVAIFTSFGLSKRVQLKEFPVQGRDGKGTIAYKPGDGTGVVVSASLVEDKDNLLVVGDTNSICISAKDLPRLGKASVGNMTIKDNKVIDVIKI